MVIFGITATVFGLLATVFGYLRGERPARTIWLSIGLCFIASTATLVGLFSPQVETLASGVALSLIMTSLLLTFFALWQLRANYKYFAVK